MSKREFWLTIILVAIIAYLAGWWIGQGNDFLYIGPKADEPKKALIKILT